MWVRLLIVTWVCFRVFSLLDEHHERNVELKPTVIFQNHLTSRRDYHYMVLTQTFRV